MCAGVVGGVWRVPIWDESASHRENSDTRAERFRPFRVRNVLEVSVEVL